jgi:predicted RNA-binding Zn-ribbon protein involved in translation (DUF1610 family)
MTSAKNKIPLVAIILLAIVVIFFTLWDIIYKKQLLQKILILYDILIIFAIVLIVSRVTKKSDIISRFRKKIEKSPENKLHYFRCPNCNGVFTIKGSKARYNISYVATCPHCRTIGRMHPWSKSI